MSAVWLVRCRLARPGWLGRPAALLGAVPSPAPAPSRSVASSASRPSASRALVPLPDMRELRSSPRPALVLGAAGLIPFAAAPVLMLRAGVFSAELLQAQLAYGACILSFLGGVRWGATLPDGSPQAPSWDNLTRAVAPSLAAWPALLVPESLGGLLLMAGLGVAAYWDMALYGYPAWFKALRFCLSVGAMLALWTALMCKWFLAAPPAPEKAAAEEHADTPAK